MQVLKAELVAVLSRRRSEPDDELSELIANDPVAAARQLNLFGVALSGGGIRSAAFNLGLLQALAHHRLLSKIDYLSTASGGGYIGCWLVAWIKNECAGRTAERASSVRAVQHALRRRTPATMKTLSAENGSSEVSISPEPSPITHLRRYSSYLAPRVGLFSVDTWVLVISYLRNFLLNLTVIGLASTAFLLLVKSIALLSGPEIDAGSLPYLSAACLLAATVALMYQLRRAGRRPEARRSDPPDHGAAPDISGGDPAAREELQPADAETAEPTPTDGVEEVDGFEWRKLSHLLVVCPVILAAVLLAKMNISYIAGPLAPVAVLTLLRAGDLVPLLFEFRLEIVTTFICFFLLLGMLCCGLFLPRSEESSDARADGEPEGSGPAETSVADSVLLIGCVALVAAAVATAGLWYVWWILQQIVPDMIGFAQHPGIRTRQIELATVVGVPLIVLVLLLTNVTFIGVAGRRLTEEQRNWWSHLGAWLTMLAIGWLALTGIDAFATEILRADIFGIPAWTLHILAWPALSAVGVYSGHRQEVYREVAGIARRAFMSIAPIIFIFGLLLLNSFLSTVLIDNWADPNSPTTCFGVAVVLAVLALVLSSRVDVNEFSMHSFYKARLVRTFLGASRVPRRSDPWTDVSPEDDMPLKSLRASVEEQGSPIPIVNCSVNFAASSRLSLQERKADSFAITPYHMGYYYRADRPKQLDAELLKGKGVDSAKYFYTVEEPAYRDIGDFEPAVTLGSAMAISGAAVSPSMGYRSSAPLAFLLTIFNVRLGAWFANPRRGSPNAKQTLSPTIGLGSLVLELLSLTNEKSRYVYLSDGGHFENLGLYELVRRHCRYILVSDATADRHANFLDLGNAIRKCRSDFGVDIEIDLS